MHFTFPHSIRQFFLRGGKKRFFLSFLLPLCLLLCLLGIRHETSAIQLRHVFWTPAPMETQQQRTIRILHLSDLHLTTHAAVERLRRALDMALPLQPDLVFFTGDLEVPTNETDRTMALAYLQALAQAAPVYACLGNHDYHHVLQVNDQVIHLLKEAGVRLLRNERRHIIVNGQPLNIVGLDDIKMSGLHADDCLKRRNESADKNESNRAPVLLLMHHPRTAEALDGYEWDIAFAGHTHGGQIRIPLLNWRPFSQTQNPLFAEPGLHPWSLQRYIHISAGIGNRHEIRIFCPPELTLFELALPPPHKE